jgi:hypothetical protein
MSLIDQDLDRFIRVQETLEKARKNCEPLEPLPDDLLDRAARSLDQPEPLPEPPRHRGSYERSLEESVGRRIAEAVAEEREAAQAFLIEILARTISEDVAPLEARVRELEADNFKIRALLYERKKPRIRVRAKAGSRAVDDRELNRTWDAVERVAHWVDDHAAG